MNTYVTSGVYWTDHVTVSEMVQLLQSIFWYLKETKIILYTVVLFWASLDSIPINMHVEQLNKIV
jgi:hypothetical protein